MMCRAPKSRAGCHFAAAIGLRSLLEDFAPTIPDYAHDMHTLTGEAMGRGLDHFRKEGAKLVPPPTEPDLPIEEKPIGCGRSSSRARDGAGRSRRERPKCNGMSGVGSKSEVLNAGSKTTRMTLAV